MRHFRPHVSITPRPVLCWVFWLALASAAAATELYNEAYRPQFHFTAKQGWLNDPNGLVFLNGQYHLFYQHNPFGTGWGNMSWGHATSPDLVHWTEKSPAIVGDPTGVKFSGTAVIDYANTAGLQSGATPTMALFYTSVGSFDQRMAYSNDGGETFRYYQGNPVLPSISGADDRDPQVFWHEGSQKWIQTLWVAAHDGRPQSFSFFGSTDLKNWNYLSEVPNYFECPDFFELPVDGAAGAKKWVLYGADGKYQVGNFNGTSFIPDNPAAGKLTQDSGANFYAAQTFQNIPASDGRRLQVAWMSGSSHPGMPFNQQMSFPVELTLKTTPDGVRMFRTPAAEVSTLHGSAQTLANVALTPGSDPLGSLSGELFHIKTQLELGTAASVGFNIRGTQVRYDVATQTLSALGRSATLAPMNGKLDLELLVDRTSLEVFGGGGRVSLTSAFLPSATNQAIDLFATGGTAQVVSLSAYPLQSAWPAQQPTSSAGLIGRWKFDDPTLMAGFADSGPQDFALANSGVVSGVSGKAGGAIDFDNPGDYAFIPDHAGLAPESFSVSLWLRPDTTGSASQLIGKSHYSLPGTWSLERLADGRLKFGVQQESGPATAIESTSIIAANAWRHVVASYNADLGRLEMYVDGALAAANEDLPAGGLALDQAPLIVGKRVVGPGTALNALDGRLDELQFYGSPLTPGKIGFLSRHAGLAIDSTSYPEGPLKLQVNVDTGAVSIINSSGAAVAVKGYSVLSNRGGLSPVGWNSLDDRAHPAYAGWEEANPTASALSEINPNGSTSLGAAASWTLGSPMSIAPLPKFGEAARNTELALEYLDSLSQVRYGEVELTGLRATNNLLLNVNTTTGAVALRNESSYAVRLVGYSITSESASLQPGNGQWTSLADQGVAGIDEANPSSSHLSELISLTANGIVLLPGQTYSLGAAFNSAGLADLKLQYFLDSAPLAGDFNGDRRVDAADYTVWRDGLGPTLTTADYQTWKTQFGATSLASATVIGQGVVRYSNTVMASAVPEPGTAALVVVGAIGGRIGLRRRRRGAQVPRPLTCRVRNKG